MLTQTLVHECSSKRVHRIITHNSPKLETANFNELMNKENVIHTMQYY